MPPLADSTRPSLRKAAPVKAPFSWPNSSLSNRFSVRPVQSTATKGLSRRPLASCTAWATSSLPVPVSPSNSTVAWAGATRSTFSSICWKAGERPTRPWAAGRLLACCTMRRVSTK